MSMILRRNILLAGSGGGPQPGVLPEGYTRLRYIQCTGAQWLDTGFTANQYTNYDVTVVPEGTKGYKAVLSARATSSSKRFELMFGYGSDQTPDKEIYFGYNNGSQNLVLSSSATGTEMRFIKSANSLQVYQHGTLIDTLTRTAATFTTPVNVILGATNNNGTKSNYFYGRLIDVNFGPSVAHFIPCKDPSDVVGMYDIINDSFKSSSTSTAFVAGPEY